MLPQKSSLKHQLGLNQMHIDYVNEIDRIRWKCRSNNFTLGTLLHDCYFLKFVCESPKTHSIICWFSTKEFVITDQMYICKIRENFESMYC